MQKLWCKICDSCRTVLEYSVGREVRRKEIMTVFGLGRHPDEHFCNEHCWMKHYDLKKIENVPEMS